MTYKSAKQKSINRRAAKSGLVISEISPAHIPDPKALAYMKNHKPYGRKG